MLAQRHRPGEASQGDFTWATKLGVTIAGELFAHLLFVFVLPFSNWTWATVSRSESMAALRRGLQRALFQLGRVTEWHQTDNSTAATHQVPKDKQIIDESSGRKRLFNEDYLAWTAVSVDSTKYHCRWQSRRDRSSMHPKMSVPAISKGALLT